jgi:hypothetical protein
VLVFPRPFACLLSAGVMFTPRLLILPKSRQPAARASAWTISIFSRFSSSYWRLPESSGCILAVSFDRFGHLPEPEGPDPLLFAQIRRLIDSGKTWIKLVAPYDASKMGAPRYADSGGLAHA